MARTSTAKALAAMDEIDADPKLSDEGKHDARAKLADEALTALKKSSALENARVSVQRMHEKWNKKSVKR